MELRIEAGALDSFGANTIVSSFFRGSPLTGLAEQLDRQLEGAISELIAQGDIKGKVGQTAVLYPRGALNARRLILVGLGNQDEFEEETARKAAAAAALRARALGAKVLASPAIGIDQLGGAIGALAQATVEGVFLALYRYDSAHSDGKEKPQVDELVMVANDESSLAAVQEGARNGRSISSGVYLARDLVNMPPNVATPIAMAKSAKAIADEHDLAFLQATDYGPRNRIWEHFWLSPRGPVMSHDSLFWSTTLASPTYRLSSW